MTVENSRERYDGPWKDGKRHGEANQVYSDGSKYVGNFKNDQRNGKVKLLNKYFLIKRYLVNSVSPEYLHKGGIIVPMTSCLICLDLTIQLN